MKYLPIEEIETGDIVARDIKTTTGQLLLRRGTEIDKDYIKVLKRYEIETVCVTKESLENLQITEEGRKKMRRIVKPHKRKLFRYALIDEMMEEMLYQTIENEIMEKWYDEQS